MGYFYCWFQELALTILTFNFFIRKRTIKKFTKNEKFKKVLDVGCGRGTLSGLFSPRQYCGVDIDKNSVMYARNKYPSYKFTVGNITNFNTQEKFDLILIVGVLHHLSDEVVDKFFNSLYSLLHKNARIVIIEAIPPILKINIVGHLLRYFDKGKFIRTSGQYKKLIAKKFKISKDELATEIFFDYAVFLAGRELVK